MQHDSAALGVYVLPSRPPALGAYGPRGGLGRASSATIKITAGNTVHPANPRHGTTEPATPAH
ncbi:hypothetical protein [Bifidobacterium breve]|uniref:hypothetical protein n=1 Tax=Bifidobacterium breve TaxID=1685 RepID=UPI0012FEBC40|nr:hypothetical protein [Bifidobacterium breve]